jgi:RNA-directed DNA polymerase
MGASPIVDWVAFDWRKAERAVYRLQKRIFKASSRGDVQVVHNLQRKLMRSRSARMLAVRRVTQDNQGKKTAGVDGKTALTPTERLQLVEALQPKSRKRGKPLPVRRVWIPKPGKQEKRPLGIPTIGNRAEQALAKQALEPEWEAKFEPNSYGFRPGRSCHDAIGAICLGLRHKPKYVLDADIQGAFDHINQEALLRKLHTYPAMHRYLKGCLKAGVMEGQTFSPTEEGTPQGGVIAPLLMNVALHGMEALVGQKRRRGRTWPENPQTIRYADDFVILCATLADALDAKRQVEHWLAEMGLEMKPSKTRITHTLENHEGNGGFDFLGFQVRQYRVGKYHSKKGFKTLIKPSPDAQQRHRHKLKQPIRKMSGAPQEELIARLNPVIRGWTYYYRTVVASKCFGKMTWERGQKRWQWAERRHPNKTPGWVHRRYWKRTEHYGETVVSRMEFKTTGARLYTHTRTKIQRHVKVKGTASPYDGNLVYGAKRNYDNPLTRTREGILLRHQKGRCASCGLYLKDGDLIELDHIIPQRLGGTDEMKTLQALHRHCHDKKTAKDGSYGVIQAQVLDDSEPDC